MSDRKRAEMTADELAAFLADGRKLQIATLNKDGTPHLVTMYYALLDGEPAFWTYRKSQKIANLERDPRITCLVETGDAYEQLRGATVYGEAEIIDDHADVLAFAVELVGRYPEVFGDAEALRPFLDQMAHKRVVVRVRRKRVASWDHAKIS